MMRSVEVDALLIHGNALSPGGVNYLSNYVPRTPVWLFYPLDGEPILMLHFHNHIPNAREMSIVDDIRWYGPNPSKICLLYTSDAADEEDSCIFDGCLDL